MEISLAASQVYALLQSQPNVSEMLVLQEREIISEEALFSRG